MISDKTHQTTIFVTFQTPGTHIVTAVFNNQFTDPNEVSLPATVDVVLPSRTDDFTQHPTGPNLGANWSYVSNVNNTNNPPAHSDFAISGGAAVPTNVSSFAFNTAIYNGFTPSDVSVTATLSVAATDVLSYAGVFARLNDGSSVSYVGVLANTGSIAEPDYSVILGTANNGNTKNLGVGITAIDIVDVGTTNSGTLTMNVYGNRLSLFFNNQLIASGTATALTAPGAVGIVDQGGVGRFTFFSATAGASFTDTFQRDDGPLTSPYSKDLNNGFNFGGGTAVSNPGLTISSLTGLNVSNVDVQATITNVGTSAGLLAQWNGTTKTGYELVLVPGATDTVQLIKWVNGVQQPALVTMPVSLLATNNLEFQAVGNTLTAYLNGSFLFSFVDTTNPLAGYGSVGLIGSGGATFSSFSVTGQ
jgi:hypothetical protein